MDERIDKIVENSATSLTYPNTKIRPYCFYQNSALETFTAPNVTDLGTFSFAYSGVRNIQFDELENEGAGASAFVGSALETGHFAKLTEIPNTFFRQCSNLQTVETDEDITKIGTESYAYSGITEASFPALTNAGAGVGAFEGSALESGSFPLLTALPTSFFRYCHLLKTLPTDNIITFGNNCLQKWGSGEHPLTDTSMYTNVVIDMESQPEGTIVTFGDACLAGNITQTGANAPANHIARVYTGDAWYEGLVADTPTSSTVSVYEPYYTVGGEYRDAEHTKTITAQEGSMVIVDTTGRPYVYRSGSWVDYIPKYEANYGDLVCSNNRMRDLGFKVRSSTLTSFQCLVRNTTCSDSLRFIIVSKNYSGSSFSVNGARGLRYLRFEQPDGTLSNVYPFTSMAGNVAVGGAFWDTQIFDIDFTNVETLGMYSLGGNNYVTTFSLPNVTYIEGGNYRGTTIGDCHNLKSIYLGNGTTTLSIDGVGIWAYNYKLTTLSLDYTSVVPFTNTTQSNLFTQLKATPIYNYVGTTTTEITQGSSVNPIMIYGTPYTAVTGDVGTIVTYNNKQWQFTRNGWTEWGTNGNDRPRVLVPTSLVPSYVTDFCEYTPDDSRYFEKWGNLSPEVYYDEFSNITPSMPVVDDSFSPVDLVEVDMSGGSYTNTYLIESISAIDITNATNVKVELYINGTLEQTIPITGACNIYKGLVGNGSVKATLSWSGSLSVSWQTLVMWNT